METKVSFSILQGNWCLAAFVLLNAYFSTSISYLTAPKLMPVAKLNQVAPGNPQNLKLLLEKDNMLKGRYLVCSHLMNYKEVLKEEKNDIISLNDSPIDLARFSLLVCS